MAAYCILCVNIFANDVAENKEGNLNFIEELRNELDELSNNSSKENFTFWTYVKYFQPLKNHIDRVSLEGVRSGKTDSRPAARYSAAKELLGDSLYNSLESIMIERLLIEKEMSTRILAMNYLSQILVSDKAKQILVKRYSETNDERQGDARQEISGKEFLAIAESLSYFGYENVRATLEKVAMDTDETVGNRINSLYALAQLNIGESKKTFFVAIEDENDKLSSQALKLISMYNSDIDTLSPSLIKLKIIVERLEEDALLNEDMLFLSGQLISEVIKANRMGEVKPDESLEARSLAKGVLNSRDESARATYIRLLWELADVSNIPYLVKLVNDPNPKVKAFAAYSFARMPKENVLKHSDALLRLLDDESYEVRRYALFSLCKGAGFPAISHMDEKTFSELKAKVIEFYADIKK
jgi:HEAT repeat protein